jgi:8-oxo-dGTP diphosphatase
VKSRPQDAARLVPAVGAVVVDPQGRILLVRRARPPAQGSWTLPGGKVERGETAEAAIVREVHEETGLSIHIVAGLGAEELERDGFAYRIEEHLAVCSHGGIPVAGDDAADARWVDRSELESLHVAPQAIGVIDRGLAAAGKTR